MKEQEILLTWTQEYYNGYGMINDDNFEYFDTEKDARKFIIEELSKNELKKEYPDNFRNHDKTFDFRVHKVKDINLNDFIQREKIEERKMFYLNKIRREKAKISSDEMNKELKLYQKLKEKYEGEDL